MVSSATTTTTTTTGDAASTSSKQPRHHGGGGGGGGVVSRLVRFSAGRTRTLLRNSLAVMGVAAVAVAYNEYKTLYPNLGDDSSDYSDDQEKQQPATLPSNNDSNKRTKKKVLLIPFHRLQLVPEKSSSSSSSALRRRLLSKLRGGDSDDPDPIVDISVQELVDMIHAAASDPSIGALYGIFGHGSVGGVLMNGTAGWADVEEIRNALRVFRESHRRHAEPNLSHATTHRRLIVPRIESKPLYAYADTFADDGGKGNKQYYLASIFTHIHLQSRGELNLFGLSNTTFFLRGFLEKYGIILHVLKHGAYKTAPNVFTEWGFNRPHCENATNILQRINADVCHEITTSRRCSSSSSSSNHQALFTTSWLQQNNYSASSSQEEEAVLAAEHNLWKRIHNAGTFPALTAWKSGLVDYLPRRDPLGDLVQSNSISSSSKKNDKDDDDDDEEEQRKKNKNKVKARWDCQETDFDRFKASQIVTLDQYGDQLDKKKAAKERHQLWAERLQRVQDALSNLGLLNSGSIDKKNTTTTTSRKQQQDEIALLHMHGTIGNDAARKVVGSIRKIAKSDATKCVVVHVSSPGGTMEACETISQELQALNVPVVFSFGNVSASGGYYIAANAHRIFCSKKTLTGSIGVFCLRPDFTHLAARYGINVEHVSLGHELAGSLNPFHPLTRKMKNNLALSVDEKYAQFKTIVAQGRGLDMEQVEALAQGRVWTGMEAKSIGLVDELGGLYRAIAYAKRNFTTHGDDAKVVAWPKTTSFIEKLLDAGQKGNLAQCWALMNQDWLSVGHNDNRQNDCDGDGEIKRWLRESKWPRGSGSMILAADEDTAIRILMDDVGATGLRGGTSMLPPPSDFWM